ncbi:microtubule-associated protein 9 [Centroberyx affinis]|uniref:microtubule-associated protein 9 n=1 Tax=Centroberyx affinis TaxID=166261 RepID=UPI003A5BCBF9
MVFTMAGREVRTLAYTKSPKASRRTHFQDELQAAVSARAVRAKADQYSFSDDFNEDDDFMKELLRSRKKRSDAFKAGKSKAKINDFELSDDEGKHSRPKKVSFLKTQRISSPLQDVTASDSHENELPDSSVTGHSNQSSSFPSQRSTSFNEEDAKSEKSGVDSQPQSTTTFPSESLSYQTSEGQLDTPLPLPSDSGAMETSGPLFSEMDEERNDSFPQSLGAGLHTSSTDSDIKSEPPRPKPRQRTTGLRFQAMEEQAEDTGSQDLSRPPTSSVSILLSTDTASSITRVSSPHLTVRSCSPHTPEGDAVSHNLSKSSSLVRSERFTKSTIGSGSREYLHSDDSKAHEGGYSTSFEDFHGDSDHSIGRLTDTRTSSSLTKSSQRPQSVCSSKVESKYMGTLKVLDRKVPLEESQPEAADSLRAAIYQEWLQKKKEKLRETMRLKKREDMLKEKKKKEEQTKKEEAVASYEVWKEKKAETLKAKAKEKQDMARKEQRANEEREEKRESAKKVFEKWKETHDELLKEKNRKQREAENKLTLKKQETEEERQRDSKSAFSNWDEKKKNVLNEKVTMERKEIKNKAEEERYKREERDEMALEMYEKWLTRKELEQRRQREERRIQAILQNSPPPPWSPPNKTIPFRK